MFKKMAILVALLVAASPLALADPISGSLSIAGTDSYNATGITFDPGTGTVLGGTNTFTVFTAGTPVTLTSFDFDATAIGKVIVSATNAAHQVVSFTLSSIPQIAEDSADFLNISGTGLFSETGYADTNGTFHLTSTTNGITSFTFDGVVPAVTPEPSSLLLLGTGLFCAAAMILVRKRRLII